jgi:glycosyltransferase involved in cell wall biosynthesis
VKQITYIFSGGRKSKLEESLIESEEFYYGVPYLINNKNKVNILEFGSSRNSLLKIFDKVMTRIFNLPFSTSKIVSLENLKQIYNSENIILVNENTAFSTLPLIILVRIFKKINVSIFVMGLYSKKLRFPYLAPVHRLFIKILIFFIDNVFFLGKGELAVAKNLHSNHSKFIYFPFSIDDKFWCSSKIDLENNTDMIFIGNDGNRDAKIILELANHYKTSNFQVVSKLLEFNSPRNNINLIKGSWRTGELTDTDIKKIYQKGRLTIIPLKESTQPSGQSVALQSMAVGIPVVITKTNGFWDNSIFLDGFNIFFVNGNEKTDWVNKIDEIFADIDFLNKVSENARNTVLQHYGLTKFNEKLTTFIK